MVRIKLLAFFSAILAVIGSACYSQVNWQTITGPVSESITSYNHTGTDGASLYVVFQNNQFYRYSFTQGNPASGTWTRLADPPRTVNAWDSYNGLAYQSGYLYTSAIPASGDGRTLLRYNTAGNAWEVWQDAGVDLIISNTSGNGIVMDPTAAGIGYSAWHAGYTWVQFDWSNKTVDNHWFNPGNISATDSSWVSRNEEIAANGSGIYYATHNDKIAGLSSGDMIYTWTGMAKGVAPSLLIQKPWQAGFGQALEFVPAGASASGHDELWLVRGSDASSSAGEGLGNPTPDWARLDLYNIAAGWVTGTLPGSVGYNGAAVYMKNSVFVRGANDAWYAAALSTTPIYPVTIGDAKTKADDTDVKVTGNISAIFSSSSQFYIEAPGRSSGIQVRYTGSLPALSATVSFTGKIATDPTTHERYIQAGPWTQSGSEVVKPLALNTRALGGASLGFQSKVYKGQGLNNIGMLVKVAGNVTYVASDTSYIYLSDGSGIADGSGPDGVKVDLGTIPSTNRPEIAVGDSVIVAGVSSMYGYNGSYHRLVRVDSADDIRNLTNDGNRPITIKVMVINFDPILESNKGVRLHQYYWGTSHDPRTLAQYYLNDLKECSKNWANYEIVEWVDADYYPIKTDGFQYTDASYAYCHQYGGWHNPDSVDYYKIWSDKYYNYNSPRTVIERVASGDVDEVWLFGAPYLGYWESCMAGPNPYFVNGGTYYVPAAGRNFITMGFNYERYIGEMLEDYGHRTESIMTHVYGSWNAYPPQHNWDYFSLVDKNITDHTRYTAGCGNVHFSPNSTADYQWGNTTYVLSTCDDWLNNWPNLNGTKRSVNDSEWGYGDIRAHHKWWLNHIPSKPGINPDGKQNNWWKYMADFNHYPESRQ